MIGKYRDGGFAEYLVMPARSLFHLPAEVPFECGAVMMCSSATAYHALRKARLTAGETVAVFGVGGLGMSAVQLACALGAREVFAVDLNAAKLELARQFGAVPVAVRDGDPVEQLLALTHGRGVDVSVELVGLPATMRQAVLCLAIQGRAALAGITQESFAIAPYQEVLNKEAEIIGVSDHLASELPGLIRMVQEGRLKLDHVVSRRLPLEAKAINEALDALEQQTDVIRSVVVPTSLDAP
jgi:propanol-preferring alcohol dehydrogenase